MGNVVELGPECDVLASKCYLNKSIDDKLCHPHILIAGTTNSPKSVNASDKKRDNGSYLDGISSDLHNWKTTVNAHKSNTLFTTLQDMQFLDCETVLDRIKKCAAATYCCRGAHMCIYYTGHGETDTGNWCFHNGTVSLDDIIKTVRSVNSKCSLHMLCDCCYSGNWCENLRSYEGKYVNISIKAASLPGQVAWDTKEGGLLTLVECGKKKREDAKKLKRMHTNLDFKGRYKRIDWYC
eukprot:157463_1